MKRILLQIMICSAFFSKSNIKIYTSSPAFFNKIKLSAEQIKEAKALIYILRNLKEGNAHKSQIKEIKLRLQKLHVMDSKGKIIIDYDKLQELEN
jgi:hypothetical protein